MTEQIDGVPRNFIENIAIHQSNLANHFNEITLGFTLKSVDVLDSILFYGFLAYCG